MIRRFVSFFSRLNKTEKQTFSYLFLAQSFNGICLGILILQEVVLRKTLSGSPFQITLLTMVNPVANLFIIFVMDIFSRIKKRKTVFMLLGVFGKLILVLMFFAESSVSFLAILIVYSILNVLLNPFFTGIMQKNVRKMNRGIIYGITGSSGTLFSVIASLFAGFALDFNQMYFQMLFAFAGVMGFLCCYFYTKIEVEEKNENPKEKNGIFDFVKPVKQTLRVLKHDKDFLLFEIFFFIYGMGFMIVLPSIPIYFVDALHLDYSQISMAKGFIGQFGLILFLPLMGFFSDRMNPMIFSAGSFFLLAFYPLLLFFSNFANDKILFVYAAFSIYSISMAGVSVLWDLSTIFFAKDKDSKPYQVVHIFLTGIRGVFVPIIGFLMLKAFGVFPVFLTSFILYITAAVSMLFLYFSYKKKQA